MGKAYTKWMDKIETVQVATEKDVIYLSKAIGYYGLTHENERFALRCALAKRLDEGGIHLTPEHQRKGTDYLLGKSLRKDGTRRKGCKLGTRELGILLSADVGHKWVSIFPQYNGMGFVMGYLPIYRAYTDDGRSFEYTGTTYDQMEVVR